MATLKGFNPDHIPGAKAAIKGWTQSSLRKYNDKRKGHSSKPGLLKASEQRRLPSAMNSVRTEWQSSRRTSTKLSNKQLKPFTSYSHSRRASEYDAYIPHSVNANLRFQMFKKNFAILRRHFDPPANTSSVGLQPLRGKVLYNRSFNIRDTQIDVDDHNSFNDHLAVRGTKDSTIYHCSELYKLQEPKTLPGTNNLPAHCPGVLAETDVELNSDQGTKPTALQEVKVMQHECREQGVQANFEEPNPHIPVCFEINCTVINNQQVASSLKQDAGQQTEYVDSQIHRSALSERERDMIATVNASRQATAHERLNYWERYKDVADQYVDRVLRPVSPKQYCSSRRLPPSVHHEPLQLSQVRDKVAQIMAIPKVRSQIHRRPHTVKGNVPTSLSSYQGHEGRQSKPKQPLRPHPPSDRATQLILEQRRISAKIAKYEQILIANYEKQKRLHFAQEDITQNAEAQTESLRTFSLHKPEKPNTQPPSAEPALVTPTPLCVLIAAPDSGSGSGQGQGQGPKADVSTHYEQEANEPSAMALESNTREADVETHSKGEGQWSHSSISNARRSINISVAADMPELKKEDSLCSNFDPDYMWFGQRYAPPSNMSPSHNLPLVDAASHTPPYEALANVNTHSPKDYSAHRRTFSGPQPKHIARKPRLPQKFKKPHK